MLLSSAFPKAATAFQIADLDRPSKAAVQAAAYQVEVIERRQMLFIDFGRKGRPIHLRAKPQVIFSVGTKLDPMAAQTAPADAELGRDGFERTAVC
jgi:hypothetical protein